MIDYQIKEIDKPSAKKMIVDNHYSHKWSSCRYAIGLFDKEILIGVAVYGFPVGRLVVKSISPLLENDEVLELTRLWIIDETPKNTESWFISKTFKWLKVNSPKTQVLISYSDPMFGHNGTIYQATNWLYQGNNTMLVKGYLHVVKGEILHPRSCVAKYGSVKTTELIKIDKNYHRIELKKKHRYIFILRKEKKKDILKTLKHKILPYNNDACTNW